MEREMSKKKKDSTPAHPGPGEATYASPVRLPYGSASLVFARGMLVAVPWEKDRRRLLASIRDGYPGAQPAAGAFEWCRDLLVRYANGDFPAPDEILRLPFAWERVSPFDRKILEATARIPAGRRETYGAMAARAGIPGCARAAGGALGRNPWPVLLPCHRVVGADGSLTGFGKGLPAKKALLAFESPAPAARRIAQ
jgi:methylated-DNA-[protein]-cysteine S-methyltransferase